MTTKPINNGVRLRNGDLLLTRSPKRDATVDAVFRAAIATGRERTRAIFAELRRERRSA